MKYKRHKYKVLHSHEKTSLPKQKAGGPLAHRRYRQRRRAGLSRDCNSLSTVSAQPKAKAILSSFICTQRPARGNQPKPALSRAGVPLGNGLHEGPQQSARDPRKVKDENEARENWVKKARQEPGKQARRTQPQIQRGDALCLLRMEGVRHAWAKVTGRQIFTLSDFKE